MNRWISVKPVCEVTPGSYHIVMVEGVSIVIGHSNGDYFALENVCSHDGNELDGGDIENGEIICPRHGAGFCLKTGQVTRPPAYEAIRRFPMRIVGDVLQIQVD